MSEPPLPHTAEPAVDQRIDLRGVACPMNFVRTKLALDELRVGGVLEVVLDDGEPATNVSRTLQDEGHEVLERAPARPGHRLVIRKTRA